MHLASRLQVLLGTYRSSSAVSPGSSCSMDSGRDPSISRGQGLGLTPQTPPTQRACPSDRSRDAPPESRAMQLTTHTTTDARALFVCVYDAFTSNHFCLTCKTMTWTDVHDERPWRKGDLQNTDGCPPAFPEKEPLQPVAYTVPGKRGGISDAFNP